METESPNFQIHFQGISEFKEFKEFTNSLKMANFFHIYFLPVNSYYE